MGYSGTAGNLEQLEHFGMTETSKNWNILEQLKHSGTSGKAGILEQLGQVEKHENWNIWNNEQEKWNRRQTGTIWNNLNSWNTLEKWEKQETWNS